MKALWASSTAPPVRRSYRLVTEVGLQRQVVLVVVAWSRARACARLDGCERVATPLTLRYVPRNQSRTHVATARAPAGARCTPSSNRYRTCFPSGPSTNVA